MGLSRERKIFVGVLGAAAAALVIDQGFLRPGSASAGQGPAPTDSGESLVIPAEARGNSAGTPGGGGMTPAMIAARLRLSGAGGSASRDAFALPSEWLAAVAPARSVPPEASEPAETAIVLSAVMPTSSGGLAVLNGVPVRVGELVGQTGYRLVSIVDQSAVLERAGARTRLDLPLPGG